MSTGKIVLDEKIGQKVFERRKQLGLTLREVSEILGISLDYVSRIEKGQRLNFSVLVQKEILKFLAVGGGIGMKDDSSASSVRILDDNKRPKQENMIKDGVAHYPTLKDPVVLTNYSSTEDIYIPEGGKLTDIYHLAGAGDPQLATGEVVISITLPADWSKTGIVPVQVKGDSMMPILLDGSIVGVDTSDKAVISGKMYAVWIEDEGAQIKTLIKGFDKVTVKSENPLSPTVEYPKEVLKDHFVLGRVRWWINQDLDK